MSTEAISANAPVAIDSLLAQRRRWAAAAIFTALAMASLDTAIANIALPAIAAVLHANPADVIWVVNVYQIAMVATLLPLAALGEVVGHRRIYLGGLLLFTLASLFSDRESAKRRGRRVYRLRLDGTLGGNDRYWSMGAPKLLANPFTCFLRTPSRMPDF